MYSRLELFDRQMEYTKMLRKAFSSNPSEETLVAWQIQDASDEIYRNYLLREQARAARAQEENIFPKIKFTSEVKIR